MDCSFSCQTVKYNVRCLTAFYTVENKIFNGLAMAFLNHVAANRLELTTCKWAFIFQNANQLAYSLV